MSDRSWRDFFESRSFYEYEVFVQKLPLRYTYAVIRPLYPIALSWGSGSDYEEGRRRRRRAGFYWCCCIKTIVLLAVVMVLMSLIGGLSYYYSKEESSKMKNQQSNTTQTTSPASNSTPTTSLNPFPDGPTIARTTTKNPIATTTAGPFITSTDYAPNNNESITSPGGFPSHTPNNPPLSPSSTQVRTTLNYTEVSSSSKVHVTSEMDPITVPTTQAAASTFNTVFQQTSPSQTVNETFALTSTQEPVDVTTSVVHTSGPGFSETESAKDHSKDGWATLGSTTTLSISTDSTASSPVFTLGLPTEDQDMSTVLEEETTLEARIEDTTTLQPWMNISSTSLSDDEDISTPEPWMDVSSSTLSDGLPDENGSGIFDDD